jgi:hypothetical protein
VVYECYARDDILCDIYRDTHSDVSDKSDNEILDSDSDIPTTSSRTQLWPSAVNITSGSETSATEEESSEPERYNNKTSDTWCKTDKNQVMSLSLEPQFWIL